MFFTNCLVFTQKKYVSFSIPKPSSALLAVFFVLASLPVANADDTCTADYSLQGVSKPKSCI